MMTKNVLINRQNTFGLSYSSFIVLAQNLFKTTIIVLSAHFGIKQPLLLQRGRIYNKLQAIITT